jgi:V/A-type H+-transporting ATPase subunit I
LTVFTLGIIGTGINSLRLQYVEFFTKFVQGGGTLYDPFGYDRKYTKENEVQP